MWKKDLIIPLCRFRTKGSMGICARFKGQVCYFVNIYSSCYIAGKRSLWPELLALKNRFGVGW